MAEENETMRQVSRRFATLTQAERFADRLYSHYHRVRLVGWPMFEESGVYTWEVTA